MSELGSAGAAVVYLVGAGPGDPGLLTLRGRECIREADVVLYDYLVNPAVLEHATPSAELVPLGRPHTGRRFSPEEITELMIDEARGGRIVVRLKGGDPGVFGRCADETEALRAAGIPFEIVPGITSGLAVAAYCEIPVTQHADASAVALVTGRERNAKGTSSLDYPALAAFPGTLVFYMGVGRSRLWSRELIRCGKPPETPVAVVRWCSRTDQRFVRSTLAEVADTVERLEIRPPSLFVVGEVVDRAPDLSWFSARPLFGRRVLIPESAAAGDPVRKELTALGAEVLLRPALRFVAPSDWTPVDQTIDALEIYDWVVFAGPDAVDHFLARLHHLGWDLRRLGRARIAALGPGTVERLAWHHVCPDLPDGPLDGESPAAGLLEEGRGRRVLLVSEEITPELLLRRLEGRGAAVDRIVVCSARTDTGPDPWVADCLNRDEMDWILVSRAATVRVLARLYGPDLADARFISAGPGATAVVRQLGHEPFVEAATPTTRGLVDAVVRADRAAIPTTPGPPRSLPGPETNLKGLRVLR